MVLFSPIFAEDKKIIFCYNFGARLSAYDGNR